MSPAEYMVSGLFALVGGIVAGSMAVALVWFLTWQAHAAKRCHPYALVDYDPGSFTFTCGAREGGDE